jgi:hypothetical protein
MAGDRIIHKEALQAREERIVAELGQLGVNYLSRQEDLEAVKVRPGEELISDLVKQPSSRVRTALIALMLAHPEYADKIPTALKRLNQEEAETLEFFYTAAVYLQQRYAERLKFYFGNNWKTLPNFYSEELGVTGDSPERCLKALASIHAIRKGIYLNWEGTYESAVRNLLRRWEMERRWKQ